MGNMKYNKGGEKFLGKMMQMGGGIDMADEFEIKMRKGGDTMRPSYKYGGAKQPMRKMQKMKMGGWVNSLPKEQIGGQSPSVQNGYKKKR